MSSTTTLSSLSLDLPPSPSPSPELNAPATINIDHTCALFARETPGNCVAPVSEYKKNGNENEWEREREIPRLYRILNLPFPPRAPPSLTTSSNVLLPKRHPDCETNIWKERVRSNDMTTNRNACHNPLGYQEKLWKQQSYSAQPFTSTVFQANTNGTKHPNVDKTDCHPNTQFSYTSAHATLPLLRVPPDDSVISTLSAERRVIRGPGPKPSTDPFIGNVSIPTPVLADDLDPSPLSSVASTTYDPNEIVKVHRRRIYPSSTEPESEWCRGETIAHVRRHDLYMYPYDHDVVKPDMNASTVEVVSPRPVSTNRYQETRRWLQRLSRELVAD